MLHKKIRAGVVPITIRNQFHLMVRRWQLFGPKNALRYYANKAFGIGQHNHPMPPPVSINPAKIDNAAVDQRFGVEASAPVPEARSSESKKWGLLYERSSETIFRHVMQKLPIDPENYVFIDLGAGKGFVLCLAAEYCFKRVVGVEYSSKLAGMAAENLRLYKTDSRQCADATCVLGDAAEFAFPAEPTVVYLYNPFQGGVMDRVISNLKESLQDHPRDVWIFYANPWEHRKFKRSREFEVIELTWDYALYHHKNSRAVAA
jgi:16S rRNA G966 N2-methylase RsmD